MDIDTGTFQANLLGCAHAFAAPKVNNNASLSGGLIRYHSAPSSVLAGLLDDDFFSASEESEFARLLSDGIAGGSFASVLEPGDVQQQCDTTQADFSAMAKKQDGLDGFLARGSAVSERRSLYIGSNSNFHEHSSQNALSAISEYGLEETVEDFCMPLSSDQAGQQAPQEPGHVGSPSFKPSCVAKLQGISFQSGLISQSSSPAEALSRLVMDENSDKVKLGPHLPITDENVGQSTLPTYQVATVNSLSDIKCSDVSSSISSPRRSNVLLRHSSSPAGLLSQINLEDFSFVQDKRPIEGTSGMFSAEASLDMKGPVFGRGRGHTLRSRKGSLADQAVQCFVDLGQRKRGRGSDDRISKGLQRSPIDLGSMTMSSFSPPSNSSPGSVDCMEGTAEESVLCKARAKRGCATHPRSIAERQRRIKISERMKKLQDLVPNLDKQASTAEMLDEVVEYVKLLQRQVQELSLNHSKCTGSCRQQGGSSSQ